MKKKEGSVWRCVLCVWSILLLLSLSGCSDTSMPDTQTKQNKNEVQNYEKNNQDESDKMTAVCGDLYEKAASEDHKDDLETIRSIVRRFGENGYVSVDSKNQIDMTNASRQSNFVKRHLLRKRRD